MENIKDLLTSRRSRRSFLAGAGAVGAAAMVTGCSSSSTTTTPTPVADNPDADILNFALNLEYLEAEYYLRAATGVGLPSSLTGSGAGTVTGGAKVTFTDPVISGYANMIAQDEFNHVTYLRNQLGGAAIPEPTIDFASSFQAMATAAGISGTFNPFADQISFLLGSFIFNDVGVTAYTGAAPLISSSTILNAAAGIQATEAYHSGQVRTLVLRAAATSAVVMTNADLIGMLRGKLSAAVTPNTTGEAILSPTQVVNCDSNALAFGRTTAQVLAVVTAGGASNMGGFFPAGFNGVIK